MDADRFDHLSRSFAERTSRRHAFRGLAGGGLLAALGLSRGESLAQDTATCALDLVGGVRVGPTFDNRPDKGGPFEFRGQLRFGIGEQGRLVDGKFQMGNTAEYDAVGQIAGPAITIRIEVAPDQTLVLVGAGENALRSCNGDVDGMMTGPQIGDLGDWHATAARIDSNSQTPVATQATVVAPTQVSNGGSIPAPTETPTMVADAVVPTETPSIQPTDIPTQAPPQSPTSPIEQPTFERPTMCLDTNSCCDPSIPGGVCCSGLCDLTIFGDCAYVCW